MKPQTKSFFLMVIPVVILFLYSWGKLPKNDMPEYFAFVDDRGWLGIPNAWNVLSNLPFLYVGWLLYREYKNEAEPLYKWPGLLFSAGMILTCFGSAYFHWTPNPETLFWDRMPMVIAFNGIFLLLVTDRFSKEFSKKITIPLLAISFGSLFYWKFFEDMRPYGLFQLGLILFCFMIAIFKRSNRILNVGVFGMAAFYFAAKVLEFNDGKTYEALGQLVSGHAMKHLFAAVAVWIFAKGLRSASA